MKSKAFSKFTGHSGILTSIIGLGIYIPILGIALSIISLISGTIWYILIAKGLYKLSKQEKA